MNPKPKPAPRLKGKKRAKPKVCYACKGAGNLEQYGSASYTCPICEAREWRKRKTSPGERKILEALLDHVTREIVRWRDAWQCVLRDVHGGACKGGVQWGHVLNQAGHKALVWELGNSHMQCAAHNHIHGPQQKYHFYYDWFRKTFGEAAWEALVEAGNGPALDVLQMRELLASHLHLWDNRPSVFDRDWLVDCGYYGEIIRDAYGPQTIAEAIESIGA